MVGGCPCAHIIMGNRCACVQGLWVGVMAGCIQQLDTVRKRCMYRVHVVGGSGWYMYILLPSLFKPLQRYIQDTKLKKTVYNKLG